MKISAVSFVYNESEQIGSCLEHLRPYVDEILIYDLESTDGTSEICKRYTDGVYKVPYLLCGDAYRQSLVYKATGDWVLWFYPDEVWPKSTMEALHRIVEGEKWSAFAFMRHEYMNNVRIAFEQDGKRVEHGTPDVPNWQNRLHKKGGGIVYPELIHFEAWGEFQLCQLPPEYYFEHRKNSVAQDFDNFRSYVWMKHLVWKYWASKVEPFKSFVGNYLKIIKESEQKNLSGERKIHLAEEFWQVWWKFKNMPRVSTDEFKEKVGVEYAEFLKSNSLVAW